MSAPLRDLNPGDRRDAEAMMRPIPRLLALGLIVVCMLVAAGCGAFVGGKLTEASPTPTPVVAAISPEPTAAVTTPPPSSAPPTAAVGSSPASVATPSPRATATPPAATRVPTVLNTPNAVAAGNLNLSATYANIGIELFFNGDDNGNATANVEFKGRPARPSGAPASPSGAPAPPTTTSGARSTVPSCCSMRGRSTTCGSRWMTPTACAASRSSPARRRPAPTSCPPSPR
ncbi:MAG: hypothetical protein U0841_02890 [Chloroflexia bacterium]